MCFILCLLFIVPPHSVSGPMGTHFKILILVLLFVVEDQLIMSYFLPFLCSFFSLPPRMSLKAEKRRLKEELRKEREAVRRKAAIEKATARKIARESMELIEDEQLELMEMAASRKGLSSIISLDHDTMQSLESFRSRLASQATPRAH